MGILTNLMSAFGPGASTQGDNPLAGTQMEGVATNDDPNNSQNLPGDTVQSQPSFWQQHPVAGKILGSLLGGPQLPQGSPQNPTQAQPQAPQTQPQPTVGNASPSNGLAAVTALMPKQGGSQSGLISSLAPFLME